MTELELLETYWLAVEARDWQRAWSLLDDGFQADWPVTGEHFDRASFIRVNEEYPGDWHLVVERLELLPNGALSVVRVDSEGQRYHAVSFFDIGSGKLLRAVEYWADGADPPEWRR